MISQQERKDGVCCLCADAPAVSDVHPPAIAEWAIAKVNAEPTPALLLCGCYDSECWCGLYPTQEELSAMQADQDADRLPMTDADIEAAEWTRNFCDGRSDQ